MIKDEETGRLGIDGKPTSIIQQLHAHKKGTPIGGGILILVLSTIFFYFLSFRMDTNDGLLQNKIYLLLITFVLFGLFGLYDDLRKIIPNKYSRKLHVSANVQLFIQLILASFISYVGVYMMHALRVSIPMSNIIFNDFFTFVLSTFTLVFIANAYNILDGIDGLGSGSLIVTLLALSVLFGSIGAEVFPEQLMIWILIGSLLGYLYYNVYPARVFNGDAGTFGVGALLAMFLLLNDLLWLAPIMYFIYIVDACTSLIQGLSKRFFNKKVFSIAPIHHAFELKGWPETKVTMRFWIANAFCSLVALAIYFIVY